MTNARYAALAVHDQPGHVARFITAGITEEQRGRLGPPPVGHGLLGVIISEGRTLRVSNMSKDPRSVGFPPHHPPMTTLLGVPVMYQGRVFGNLYVTDKENGEDFTDEDELSLSMLGQQAAIAVENARIFSESEQRATEARTLHELGKLLNSSLSLDDILESIVDASMTVLRADKVLVWLLDSAAGMLRGRVARGFSLPPQGIQSSVTEGIVGRVATSGRTAVVQDTIQDPTVIPWIIEREQVRSLIHVPIIIRGAVYGVFSAHYFAPNAVPPNAPQLLEGLADQAGLAIQNAQLFEQVATERNALESLFNSLTDGVYTVDLDRRVQRMNHIAVTTLGLSTAEALGRPAWEVFPYSDEAARAVQEDHALFAQLSASDGHEPVELYLQTPAGRVPVAVTASPIRDAQGAITGMVEVFRDIRRQRELDEMKASLISLVSHELRTPLSHIKGFVSTLLQPDVEWDQETTRDFLETIDRQADRLAKLVGDLLEMSRLESGWRTDPEPTSPSGLVTAAVKQAAPFIREHQLVVDLPERLPWVQADAPQVERVLANLLENAAKYSPPGSTITVTAEPMADELVFSIADQGVGVAPEDQEKVFEKFYRAPQATYAAPGTGLGLPICRSIVVTHGGRIWIESARGQGSRFRFTLPLSIMSGGL
ncbi:MAG: GAF domain-containing protein [Chloroflexi bacterium]|nr:GAF domain-containing protein [Chloroflexota bacterium]